MSERLQDKGPTDRVPAQKGFGLRKVAEMGVVGLRRGWRTVLLRAPELFALEYLFTFDSLPMLAQTGLEASPVSRAFLLMVDQHHLEKG